MRLFGDKRRRGTHYQDRVNRIVGVCHACGILWQESKTVYHGKTETYRQELVRPIGEVVLTPTLEKYGLTVNPAVLDRIKRMGPQFALALNERRVRVEVDGDVVYICVPRDEAEAAGVVTFEDAWALAPDLDGALLCGVTDEGAQAVLDLADPGHAHCVAIGLTGSGKTTLLQTMLLSAEMQGLRVAILDPLGKRGGLWALSGHPSVWGGGLFADPGGIERALAALAHGDSGDVFVFVDETPALCRARPGIGERLTELAQVGRHAGVHLVLGSQSATGLPMLQNVSARLVGRVADRQAAYFASGREASGAETLRGKGDMLFACGDSLLHFQAAMVLPETLQAWARRYPPRGGRLQAEPPTPVVAPPMVPMGNTPTVATETDAATGRMLDGIPRRVVRDVRAYYGDHKRSWPSLTWMETRYGYRRSVARRAINCAAQALDMPLPYPNWEREYSADTVKRLEVAQHGSV